MLLKRALLSAAAVFTLMCLSAILSYIFRIVLAKNLSQAEYGLFFAAFALLGLFQIFQGLGLGPALARKIAELRPYREWSVIKGSMTFVFLVEVFIGIAAAAVLFVLADWLAQVYFKTAAAKALLKIFSIAIAASPVYNFIANVNLGLQRQAVNAGMETAKQCLTILLAGIAFALGLGLIGAATAVLLALLLSAAAFAKGIFGFLKKVFGYAANFSAAKELLGYGLQIVIYSAAAALITLTDTLMLTALKPLNQVALYNVAAPTARVLMLLPNALAIVLFPIAAELWTVDRQKLARGLALMYKWTAITMIPLALTVLAWPKLILGLFFGLLYSEAALALQILVLGILANAIATANISAFAGIGKPWICNGIVWFAVVANIVVNVLLIPPLGIVGAASASALAFGLMLALSMLAAKAILKVQFPALTWLTALISGAAFVGTIGLLKLLLALPVAIEFVFVTAASVAVYIALLLLTKVVTLKEVQSLLVILYRR